MAAVCASMHRDGNQHCCDHMATSIAVITSQQDMLQLSCTLALLLLVYLHSKGAWGCRGALATTGAEQPFESYLSAQQGRPASLMLVSHTNKWCRGPLKGADWGGHPAALVHCWPQPSQGMEKPARKQGRPSQSPSLESASSLLHLLRRWPRFRSAGKNLSGLAPDQGQQLPQRQQQHLQRHVASAVLRGCQLQHV